MQESRLADAFHLIQDQWPIGDRYQPWRGYAKLEILRHGVGDFAPDLAFLQNALNDSVRYLDDLIAGKLGDPSKYLHNFCQRVPPGGSQHRWMARASA
jgi:hypothetical protein